MQGIRRAVGSILMLMCALTVGAATQAMAAPSSDLFYTPPAGLAAIAPGTILRSREVTMSGTQESLTAAAYQLMFRTTSATGQPTAAVTTVLVPTSPAAGTRVLATYEAAYDSMTLNCAPSYTLQGGNDGGGSTATLEQQLIADELAQGWDVNIPDYEGLQSEWAVGPQLGHASLDSVRAVEHFAADGLTAGAATRVTFNGYSGGSEAATWAAALAPSYAPELHIIGVAAGGNFPDFDYTLSQFDGSLWYGTEIGVMEAFSRAYSDFDLKKLLNAAGQALAAKDGTDAGGCGGSTLNEPFGNASQYTNFPSSEAMAADPLVKSVLARMGLRYAPYPTVPLFLYNSVDDELAHIVPVDALVKQYCAAGVTVDYDRDPAGGDHLSAVARYWPPALQYLEDRFAGDPAPDNCPPGGTQPSSPAPAPAPAAPPRCPRWTGRIDGGRIGQAMLGLTRARVRRDYRHTADLHSRYGDVFCLYPAPISIGVPTAAVLRALPRNARGRLRGRVDWILTSNAASSLRGIRPGSVLTATRRAELRGGYARCSARWYVVADGRNTGLVEVARNTVEAVGVVSSRVTHGALIRRRLIASLPC